MRGKLFFSAATAALLMLAPSAAAQTMDVPGDASTEATFSGEAVNGRIDSAGDVDWYRMEVQQGLRYALRLDGQPGDDGNTLDPMLGVYDASGNQLAFNDDANGTLNSALVFTPPQSGTVFIEARAFSADATGGYQLAGTSAPIPPDDAGNDRSTRARVAAGTPVTGEIESEGDVDWYRLNVRTGQRYHITLDGAEGAAAPLGDPVLRVVTADGEELAMNDDSDSLNSALDFTPARSGDVYVEASGYSSVYTGTYTLSVTNERAPHDSISADTRTRGRISVGRDVTGTLDYDNDTDWYRMRMEEGASYRFALTGTGDNALRDPLLMLMNSDGEQVAMDDDGGDGLNSYLEFTAPSTGNYYLSAQAFDGGRGAYRLTALTGDIPASTATDASVSADGDYREGVLSPAGDTDWYRLDLAEGQAVRIGLNTADGADGLGDPYLVLYGPDGAELARDDDGGEGLNSWLEYQASAAGTYYVEARAFTEEAQGRYILTVTPGEIANGFDGAEYLTPGFEGRTSMIGTPGDSDWFLIEMVEGRPYRFNVVGVEPNPLADPMLTIYDAQGNQVAQDDDGGAGLNPYLTFVSPRGGTYVAAVSSFEAEGTGRYTLTATDTDVPGQVYTDETLDAGAADDRVSRIDMEGDLDYYRVELEGGVSYQIEVNGHGEHPLADPFVAIVNEADERITSDDDSGPGLDARLRFTPEQSGVYFIQASGLGGSTGWYQVSITRR